MAISDQYVVLMERMLKEQKKISESLQLVKELKTKLDNQECSPKRTTKSKIAGSPQICKNSVRTCYKELMKKEDYDGFDLSFMFNDPENKSSRERLIKAVVDENGGKDSCPFSKVTVQAAVKQYYNSQKDKKHKMETGKQEAHKVKCRRQGRVREVVRYNGTVKEDGREFQTLLMSQTGSKKQSVFTNMFKHSTKLKQINESIQNTKLKSLIRKLDVKNTSAKHTVFNSVTENMTIVTAYFNLGSFRKGGGIQFTPELYFRWTTTFAYLVNPLVIYTDSQEFEDLMKKHRQKFPLKTVIKRIKRDDIWAFRCRNEIKCVYSQLGYPKHHPNTVIPAYSSAQHAKYAVVAESVRQNYFNTEFYAWLDIGYFRDIVSSKTYFRLDAPSNIDRTKLAMNRVYNRSVSEKPYNIIRQNIVWVGGGMFIGTKEIVLKFEKLYHKAVSYFLSKKLMNTDQQVIYSMYSNEGRAALKPDVELQLFIPKGNGNPWFYQGYLCRHVLKI